MDIALAQIRRVEGLKLPEAPAGVVGVISGFPLGPFACAGGGSFTFDVTDTNSNGLIDNGDVFVIAFTNCVEPDPIVVGATSTTNGSMSLAIASQSGLGTPASPALVSVTMSFANFSVVDTAPNPDETMTMSGAIAMAISDNGTAITSTMSGTSFTMTSTTDGTFTLKGSGSGNFAITYTEDSPTCAVNNPAPSTVCAGNYSFSVTMTTNIAALGGEIDITTPTAFTGNGSGEPTAGVMLITGANGGTLTLTAQPDGLTVAEVLDTDGAAGPTAPQTLTSTSWTAI